MDNKELLIKILLSGSESGFAETRASALIAIGESGLIDDERLINALKSGAESGSQEVKQGAYTGMGMMLKSANRQ
ncbi:TPA: hypothetical protein P2N00_000480 [Aeromonas salmonicida]|uniref:HEAT repeat domain-containing protein n=1 Tax=Aeromonas salmonicida subsp. salmonicida TaxID=29491 RepID=A0A8F3EQD1_AERSS|nr:hypothetical protein [Aeromonas salmonicida]MBM9522623.1 hypothetical protein [Aeromonas salmonicida subsp. salmonicida]QWY91817.1 hypothetical protein [Aeromonas salmonicida subsp. salmonicida]HDN9784842.1 hypothetical protein [Aeromonas salmonicida]HDN9804028.1 hypothetical protein [Aeromonas salmonicida]HDN9816783.1 hypothetical protein [Aeromonas salmonicida]